jgi:hypothetical protein
MDKAATITITKELLDELIDHLTYLPYRDTASVFHQLNLELSAQKDDSPKIVLN